MFYLIPHRVTAPDIPVLQAVGRAAYEPYYARLWHPGGLEWYMHYCFNTPRLHKEIADPNIGYWLAMDPEMQTPAGMMKLVYTKPVHIKGPLNALFLEKIYLLPEYMGRSLGHQLIEWVMEAAKNMGRSAVWLTTMKSGPVKAYERAGFEICEEMPLDFGLLLETEREMWVMRRMIQ